MKIALLFPVLLAAAVSACGSSDPAAGNGNPDAAPDGAAADKPFVKRPRFAKDTVVAAPGPDPASGATLSLLEPSGAARGQLADVLAGVKFGARVAACDLDGDGYDELVVSAGSDAAAQAKIRLLEADGSPFAADLAPAIDGAGSYGLELACGDFDGDGDVDIAVAPGPSPTATAQIVVLAVDGAVLGSFTAHAPDVFHGARLAAGDLDGDGRDEIIVAPGPHPGMPAHIKIFHADGAEVGSFMAFPVERDFGAHVAAGDVDGDGKDEILVSPGPTPTSPAHVRVFRGDGTMVNEIRPTDPAPHLELYGFYHVNNTDIDHIPEVASFTNWVTLREGRWIPSAVAHKQRVLFTMGWSDDETTWPNKIRKYQAELNPHLAALEALIVIDEPDIKMPEWDTAKQGRIVALVKQAFPGIPTVIAYANANRVPPDNVDWISPNTYMWGPTYDNSGCTERALFEKIRDSKISGYAKLGKPLLVTLPSFEMKSPFQWNFPSLCQQRWFMEAILEEPAVHAMTWFLWPNNIAAATGQHELVGTIDKPEVVALLKDFWETVRAGGWGANLAAGDVDGDGKAEIVIGQGEGRGSSTGLRVYKADGTPFSEPVVAFPGARYGVQLALGRFVR